MRVLITGATGFLGRRVARDLLARGDVRLSVVARDEIDTAGAVTVVGDLARGLPRDLPDEIDAIVHLAQSPRYRDFPEGAADVFAVNVAATHALLEYGRRARASRFILASSGSVYSVAESPRIEEDPVEASGFYPSSKRMAEILVDQYAQVFCTAILRFFPIYGEGQLNRMVPDLIERIENGRAIDLVGRNGLRFNPIYVDDAATAVIRSLTLNTSTVFNVAGGETTSIRVLSEMLGGELGRAPRFSEQPGPEPVLVGDISRMEAELGAATVQLGRGIERTIRAHQDRE